MMDFLSSWTAMFIMVLLLIGLIGFYLYQRKKARDDD
ncbi:MAG: LPXTG cell wall anchor domain-containing protein [Gemmataceae bacterium]